MQKIKIRIDSVEFSTNENNDTLCKVTYQPHELMKRTVFWAKAKLHAGDTYNKEMGRRIAFAKAERKAYKHARKNVKHDIEEIKAVLEAAQNFYDKADGCFVHNDNYIKQLCGC